MVPDMAHQHFTQMRILIFFIGFITITNAQNYTNPTTDIKCGRYDNCNIACSNSSSCQNLNFIFENDWTITQQSYTASLICSGYCSCQHLKIFGNRTSSINIDISPAQAYPYCDDFIDVHILFSNYNHSQQIANINCGRCQTSKFWYSSSQHNASLVSPSDGIVNHRCQYCGDGHLVSAQNVYQLQMTCESSACQNYIHIFPPIHDNSNDSFVFISNASGIDTEANMFFYFLNGLHGKQFVCHDYVVTIPEYNITATISCDSPYNVGVVRIYCGPYFNVLGDAEQILAGSYSKDCKSIYDTKVSSAVPQLILQEQTLVFDVHRLYKDYSHYIDVFNILNDSSAVIIMGDSIIPGAVNTFSTINLPSNANIILFCIGINNGFTGLWSNDCGGYSNSHTTFNASDSLSLTVVKHELQYTDFVSGLVFHSFELNRIRWCNYYLQNSDIVYMVPIDKEIYDLAYGISDPAIHLFMNIHIGNPRSLTLKCEYNSACDDTNLYATGGSYKYIPRVWKFSCMQDTYSAELSCDPFQLTFGDGSSCEMDPPSICNGWLNGPAIPTRSPVTPNPTAFPVINPTNNPSEFEQSTTAVKTWTQNPTVKTWTTIQNNMDTNSSFLSRFILSVYSIVTIATIVFLLVLLALIGVVHKNNVEKKCFSCLKPADDARPFALITFAFGVWDFLSDWNWAFSISYDEYTYYFYGSIALNIASLMLNLIYLFRLISKYKQESNLAAWLRKYFVFMVLFTVISGKASAALSLCNCHLFGLNIFEMGLPFFRIQIEINRWKILFNTILLNIPQIILQMLYVSVSGSLNMPTFFALLSSSCSVILTISIFVMQAGISSDPKNFDIEVQLSGNDAMDPKLQRKRYLRQKTAFAISEATLIDLQCICVEKISAPLIIRVSINHKDSMDVIFDVLNSNKEELSKRIKAVFDLTNETDIVVQARRKFTVIDINAAKSKSDIKEPLLHDFDTYSL